MTVLDQNNGNMKNLNYKAGINITLKQHVVVLRTFTTLALALNYTIILQFDSIGSVSTYESFWHCGKQFRG